MTDRATLLDEEPLRLPRTTAFALKLIDAATNEQVLAVYHVYRLPLCTPEIARERLAQLAHRDPCCVIHLLPGVRITP